MPPQEIADQPENALARVGITVNKNMIPFDPASPRVTSGIRIGTAAVTSRGFTEGDIERVAKIIGGVLKEKEGFDPQPFRKEVSRLCRERPLYLAPVELQAALTLQEKCEEEGS
ncbi:MAG: hypothetical protein ACP5DY_06510 [Thermovirgaceae bacterium]